MDDNNKKILALGAAATLGTILLGYLFYRSRDRHTSRQSDQNNTKKSEEIPEKEAIPQLKKKVDDEDEERFVKGNFIFIKSIIFLFFSALKIKLN